eukprot:scaffold183389_cov35-Tisochrysis_lutea.AAC.1
MARLVGRRLDSWSHLARGCFGVLLFSADVVMSETVILILSSAILPFFFAYWSAKGNSTNVRAFVPGVPFGRRMVVLDFYGCRYLSSV